MEIARIAKEIGDDQLFIRKELAHLPEVLSDGEQVFSFASGVMSDASSILPSTWLIVLTNRRIIFLDKGMLYGLQQTIIDLDKVTAISGKTGLLLGEITIEASASSKTIKNVNKKTVTPFTNHAQRAIEARKTTASIREAVSKPQPQEEDVFSKLERLAALKERGILTDEEFSQQKARILSM